MATPLNFHLFQPKDKLSPYIQGIWSASLTCQQQLPIKHTLLSDACSGITFVLAGEVLFASNNYSSGIIYSPTSKEAQTLTIMPGTRLAGFRFKTGSGFGFLGQHVEQVTAIEDLADFPLALEGILQQLQLTYSHYRQILILYQWLCDTVTAVEVVPESLRVTLEQINNCESMGQLAEQLTISQRQLERLFKQWVDLTPKHYQRILRVKNTLEYLKRHTQVNLAELALEQGFTDQAHMQREIKQIAHITPKAFVKRYL